MTDVVKYRIKNHIFVEYDCEKHGHIKQRIELYKKIGCPYCHRGKESRLVYGVGIMPKGFMGKNKTAYNVWIGMLLRCYSKHYQEKEPSYIGKIVCDEWKNFEFFLEWFNNNYIDGYQLDKDIIHKGNKVYAPEHCAFVPYEINYLLLRRQRHRGSEPIGVCFDDRNYRKSHYRACVQYKGKQCYHGYYKTREEAFAVYKREKEKIIKKTAEEYKDKIDVRVYDALMEYEVEITD